MVDTRDALLQSVTPIVVAPLFGPPLSPLQGSCHRSIVAQNGLWLELVRPWLRIVTKISDGPEVRMPAGEITELFEVPHPIPSSLVKTFVTRAQGQHLQEQAVFITMDTLFQFSLVDVEVISSSAEHINYRCPRLPAGHELVVDLHSHAKLPAFFSPDDNDDDNEMVKISVVVGNCDRATPSFVARLCVLGKKIPIPLILG